MFDLSKFINIKHKNFPILDAFLKQFSLKIIIIDKIKLSYILVAII